MVPPTTFKPAEARVTRCARKGSPNHFLTILATGSHPCLPCCTLVASKIDYIARSRPDVFSPATARHASPHYRYITPVIYKRARQRRKCNRIKNESSFRDGERRTPFARRKSRELSSTCWSDKTRTHLFSPRNLYTKFLAERVARMTHNSVTRHLTSLHASLVKH